MSDFFKKLTEKVDAKKLGETVRGVAKTTASAAKTAANAAKEKAETIDFQKISETVKHAAGTAGDAIKTTAGIGIGEVTIETNQDKYVVGDKVKGTVTLNLEDPIDAKALLIELKVVGRRRDFSSDEDEKPDVERDVLYRQEIKLDEEKSYPAGASEYDYTFELPEDYDQKDEDFGGIASELTRVVTQFTDQEKPTTWTLTATLDVPWKRNLSSAKALDVRDDEIEDATLQTPEEES